MLAAVVDDAADATTFHGTSNNAQGLWKPTTMAMKQSSFPRLVYTPKKASLFATGLRQTPWEIHNFVSSLLTEDNGELEEKRVVRTSFKSGLV